MHRQRLRLTFGVLLLTGGKLADLIGGSRIFIVGLAIFTASSFFCGFAGQRVDVRARPVAFTYALI